MNPDVYFPKTNPETDCQNANPDAVCKTTHPETVCKKSNPETDFQRTNPETVYLQTEPCDSGMRLDVWIAEHLDNISRSAAARLIVSGNVRVNGQIPSKSARVTDGETVEITLFPPEPLEAVPQNIPLDIVFEDADVIVVNKPKGLVVHPAPGHPDGTLVNALLYHCGDSLSGIGGTLRPGIVHRIDRDTSGLIIAAKNDFAHQHLAAQLQNHTLSREYECIVTGVMREDSGTVRANIGRHPADRKKMTVTTADTGRPAVTHWNVLERLRGHTCLQCRLETGRTHQIRVHMAFTGHPVLGDPVYGKAVAGLQGQCLHAIRLRFVHPRTGETVVLSSPLPDEFVHQLNKLRLR